MSKKNKRMSIKSLFMLFVLIIVFGALFMVMPISAASEHIALTDADTESVSKDDHIIEEEPVPLGYGSELNYSNGSWSIWLLIPIMAVASFGILFGVRLFVDKKKT